MSDEAILTCAVSGGHNNQARHPDYPITPEHIARDCIECARAGAAIAHIHVRDPETGMRSGDPALFREVVERIREVLETEVRPAVAMDGGDVIFVGFEDGVVQVMLQGACVGCPSSTATLRFGIEARLTEAIPEVLKVIQV